MTTIPPAAAVPTEEDAVALIAAGVPDPAAASIVFARRGTRDAVAVLAVRAGTDPDPLLDLALPPTADAHLHGYLAVLAYARGDLDGADLYSGAYPKHRLCRAVRGMLADGVDPEAYRAAVAAIDTDQCMRLPD